MHPSTTLPRRPLLWSLIFALPLASLTLARARGAEPEAAETEQQTWRYTTTRPADDWFGPRFDDGGWERGRGGFGTQGTPGARLGTKWDSPEIWLRRHVALTSVPAKAALFVHHDEDAEVYVNGQQVAKLNGYTTNYRLVSLDASQRAALRQGDNLLAVHCRQTGGGQYIDVQLVDAADLANAMGPDGRPLVFRPTLRTSWAQQLDTQLPWPEYPRPQLVRERWANLNGLWDYAIQPADAPAPRQWDGRILVPFAIESQLSGVTTQVGADNALWYRRTFQAARPADGGRLLLQFGAVDWQATVWVNGQQVGTHQGGYDPFALDITDAITEQNPQQIVIRVWDPTTDGPQPVGKQRVNPGGIFYTPVTGIWQTVWLEPVAATHVQGLKLTPDVDAAQVTVEVALNRPSAGERITAEVMSGGERVADYQGTDLRFTLNIPQPRLWSPDDPFLYDVRVTTSSGDRVTSYFGMRKISVKKDPSGVDRLALNNRILFQIGPLDQGWWPDGLYTAATDEALRYDIEVTRRLGFNATRKHVKVEPARWYYWCDKLGLLVWQDMPSSFVTNTPVGGPEGTTSDETSRMFVGELTAMLHQLYNHPCIVIWVPFNEGWGQHRTNEILRHVQQLDPTRLVDAPSGWMDFGFGDLYDMHRYPGPGMHPVVEGRVSVLGEFGGVKMAVPDHMWNSEGWGYVQVDNRAQLQTRYNGLIEQLRPLMQAGLSAAIYTQLTDVETEVNGLLTYDRAVIKLDVDQTAKQHQSLYAK